MSEHSIDYEAGLRTIAADGYEATVDVLRDELARRGLVERVYLPADGETLHFGEAAVDLAEGRSRLQPEGP